MRNNLANKVYNIMLWEQGVESSNPSAPTENQGVMN